MPPRRRERTNTDSDEYVKKSFELMLSLLRDNQANPHRMPTRPSMLASACLLPDCRSQTAAPLSIDTRTAHYHCNACDASGTPTTYMARLWQISASNAHALIEHYPLEKLKNGRPPMTAEMLETRQDSYPLQVAMTHYAAQMETSLQALRWLTKMELTPETAHEARIGFSTGEGLREALSAKGLEDAQIAATNLFSPSTGEEKFAGNIIIADADHTGAVTWLISTNPARDTAIPGYRITPNPPSIAAMPFQGRSALLGIQRSYDRSKPTLLTDDVRAYVGALAHGAQGLLIVHRSRREEPQALEHRLNIMAETLVRRTRTAALVIATHHSQVAAGLRNRIETQMPDLPVLAAGKSTTLRIASPATRNFNSLFNQNTFRERAEAARKQLDAHPTVAQAEPSESGEDTHQESQEVQTP